MKIYFYDSSLGSINSKKDELQLEFIDFGGQGQIYKWRYRGKTYVMKVILDDDSVLLRLREIREVVKKMELKIPDNVRERGFPVAQGTADPLEFEGFSESDQLFIVVYNWIEGVKLHEYLENEPPLSDKRKFVTRQILEILCFFEKAGIVHNDLYPKNFIVKPSGSLYIIDMEGAGLFNPAKQTWIWKPAVLEGGIATYPNPPESLFKPGEQSIFADRWTGTILIFESLLGKSPFQFLRRIDLPALLELYEKADKENIAWPPYGSEKIESIYLNPELSVQAFRNEIRRGQSIRIGRCSPLEKLAYLAFVYGFERPAQRPNFAIIRELLLKEIVGT
jgi:serine/threonine protein kinase